MNTSFFKNADSLTMKINVFIWLSAFLTGFGLFAFVYNYEEHMNYRWIYFPLAGVLSIITFYILKYWSAILDKKVSWTKKLGSRLLLGIIFSYCISIAMSFGLVKAHSLLTYSYTGNVYLKLSILLLLISVLANVVYLIFYSFNHYTTQQLHTHTFEREQIDLQLTALKSQISPHFLFNNLNTISYLISEDKNRAKSYIRKMASCYQYILDSYKNVLVKLRDEVNFVDAYQFLIQTRHNDAILVSKKFSEKDLECKVPSLCIQLLVENAVKHNEASADHPLTIKLYADKDNIIVSNPKRKKTKLARSTKLGLKNIISRYRLLSSKKVEIEDGELFTVKLPKIR